MRYDCARGKQLLRSGEGAGRLLERAGSEAGTRSELAEVTTLFACVPALAKGVGCQWYYCDCYFGDDGTG